MGQYVKVALSILPLTIGLMYLIGVIYDASYFNYWGLDSDEFPRSLNDTLVRGVLALMEIGSVHAYTTMAVTGTLFFVAIILNTYLERRAKKEAFSGIETNESNGNVLRSQDKRPVIPKWANVFGIITAILAVLSSGYFLLTLAFALLAAFVSNAGEDAAMRREAEITSTPWSEDSRYDVNVELIDIKVMDSKRRLVTCVPEKCVFLTPEGVESIDRKYIAVMRTKVRQQ